MRKRFTVRKVHQYAYARQGWAYKDCGFVYVVTDRDWKKNSEASGINPWGLWSEDQSKAYRNIEIAHSKEVAQFWADWLNANCIDTYGHKIIIPGKVFSNGLELYHK